MARSVLVALMLVGTVAMAHAADLAALRPSAAWLRTERLRGTLFHQPNIQPLSRPLIEPALPGAPAAEPVPVVLWGRHGLVVLVEGNGRLDASLARVERGPAFGRGLYAVFSPEGEQIAAGETTGARPTDIRLEGLRPGPYVLWLDSGPASSTVLEVTVRNRHWALDGALKQEYERSPMHYHFLRDLKLGGFNLAMVDVEGLSQSFITDEGLGEWTKLVRRWTDYGRDVGLRVMPAIDLGGTSYEIEAWEGLPPGLYIEEFPNMPVAPCPLRKEYWEAILLRRGREVAKLARDNPNIVGIGIDPEMYMAWSYGHYMLSGTCFCDHCLGGFLKQQGRDEAVLRERTTGKDRHDWLVAEGLEDKYNRYLADQMAEVAGWCRDELHAIAPDFMLCVYVLEAGNWFCEGLARGFSEPDLPVINFCESTYYSLGYDRAWLDATHERFRSWGANVLQGSALWDRHFPPTRPEFLAAHAYNCGANDEGWWYWPGDRLYQDWGATQAYLNRPAYAEDYWQACVWANREIAETLSTPDRTSPLDTAEVVPWRGMLKESGIEGPPEIARDQTEAPFEVCVVPPSRLYFAVPERAKEFTLYAQARGAENGGQVTVRDPSGATAGSVGGELDSWEAVKVSVTQPGVWSVEVAPTDGMPAKAVGLRIEGLAPLSSSTPEACLAEATKKPGLIGYWPLDEGKGTRAADRSGSPACEGVVSGAEWVPGRAGDALHFDGKTDEVAIATNWAYNNLTALSLSAWVKLDALPQPGNGATLVNKGPEALVQHFWWWIGYPPDYALILELGSEKHQWGSSADSGALQWELGRWYHVATTFTSDGASSRAAFYRDGELVGERTLDEPFHSGSYDFKLGTYGGGHLLNGALDEVKLWDRVLSAEEVREEYRRAGG